MWCTRAYRRLPGHNLFIELSSPIYLSCFFSTSEFLICMSDDEPEIKNLESVTSVRKHAYILIENLLRCTKTMYTEDGGRSMKPLTLIIFGFVICAFSLCYTTYAADQDVNFLCRSDCLARGGTIGQCNALCSTANESGDKTKDANCLSSCMGKSGETAFSCYSKCDTAGNTLK